MKHRINEKLLKRFREQMLEEEKAEATISKYMHDVRAFLEYAQAGSNPVDKELVLSYKEMLKAQYAASSVNSMLAALNCFFKAAGWYDCIVKLLKIQKEAFRDQQQELTREEYYRLLKTARKKGSQRMYLLMQTICSTGIRVSELRYITVEALKRGQARVTSKGKMRTVLLPGSLRKILLAYVRKTGLAEGSIFVTRGGRPMDRSNICHAMKDLCKEAGVEREKVFPHNLRHLFACTYYKVKKDLSHLADILGHSNINTTRIYTLASGKEQIRQIETLGLVV